MTDLRTRVLDATFAEVEAGGLEGLTVEAVAARAGSSRATVYRHFPGGRDELVATTIEREVRAFFSTVLDGLPGGDDLHAHVVALVDRAHRMLDEHAVLQQLLRDEAEAFVPSLTTVQPLIFALLADHLAAVFERVGLRAGVDVHDAAVHCARMILSYVGSGGVWDLHDGSSIDALVRTRILAGLVDPHGM